MEPSIILALLSQGLTIYADFADRATKGTLTDADLDEMAARLDVNIEGLRADIAKAKAEGR